MRSESLVFLLGVAISLTIAFGLLARTSPRDVPSRLLALAPGVVGLLAWFGWLAVRGLIETRLVVGLLALLAAATLAQLALERRLRRKYNLTFFRTGIRAFEEKGVSGRCLDTAASRLFGAARSLVVTVTRDELWVRPLGFLPGVALGLVHRVPLRRIHLMERLAGKRANVRLEYAGQDGWCRCVELRLRNPGPFIEAVREGQLEGLE